MQGDVTTPSSDAEMSADEQAQDARVPLCVDLDGTLILQDSLHEVIWNAGLCKPFATFRAVLAGLSDRAEMKRLLAEIWSPGPGVFRWRGPLIDALREEKAKGRRLVLATGADQSIADRAAAEIGIFDEAIGSRDGVNLTAERKAAALVKRFGEGGFDYVGDSRADLRVWPSARQAWLAGGKLSPESVETQTGALVLRRFAEPGPGGAMAWLRAMRVYQWVKNLLVFIPVFAAGAIFEGGAFQAALTAFFCFSLCASGVYLINDLVDVDTDRLHPRKRQRPFASGALPMLTGAGAAVLLIAAGMAGAMWTSTGLFAVLALYLCCTFLYSFWLKKLAMFDVFSLAGLYCLRPWAGGVAAGIELSVWLLSFFGFLFLSLACLKRVGELAGETPDATMGRRGYLSGDAAVLAALGLAMGIASSIIFTQYILSNQAQSVFEAPGYLWGFTPFYLLWLCRLWLLSWRGKVTDDPIVSVLRDPASWLLGLLGLTLIHLAHHPLEGLSWRDFGLAF